MGRVMSPGTGAAFAESGETTHGETTVNATAIAAHGSVDSTQVPASALPRAHATILLIDDDHMVAGMLRDRLGARGYTVWHAATGAEAEAIGDEIVPDLVIVDLVLPDANGLVLCSDLRQRWTAPIIICTASRRPEDAVLGFKLGADDFVRKPFSTDELEARIEAALRRPALTGRSLRKGSGSAKPSAEPDEAVQVIGPLEIDRARCRVRVDGEQVHLTPTEFRLLCALADRPNRVVSSTELAQTVWGSHDPGIGRSLQVHVRRMRAKLTAGRCRIPAIVATRGFGYQLVWDTDAAVAAGGA